MSTLSTYLDSLLSQGILPHASKIADVADAGGISVVVFKPSAGARAAARVAGWDGKFDVFPMTEDFRNRLAGLSDAVTAQWLRRNRGGVRLFVISGKGTLLLNHGHGRGWYLEPGSTEMEQV